MFQQLLAILDRHSRFGIRVSDPGVVRAPALGVSWARALASDGNRVAYRTEAEKPGSPIAALYIPDAGATVVTSRWHGDPAEMQAFWGSYTLADQRDAGSSIKF